MTKMQCKDLPDLPILEFLSATTGFGATWFDLRDDAGNLTERSVLNAMPNGTPATLARAKMTMLIRRGLVDGCSCGCRGDYEITDAGKQYLCSQRVDHENKQ